jgi:hypothetical protein
MHHDGRGSPAFRCAGLDPVGPQPPALDPNDGPLHGDGFGRQVYVGPRDAQGLAQAEPGGVHEPRRFGPVPVEFQQVPRASRHDHGNHGLRVSDGRDGRSNEA